MAARAQAIGILALLAFMPAALADSIFSEDACAANAGCSAHVDCSAAPSCAMSGCANVPGCAVSVSAGTTCGVNDTIAGHTCATGVAAGIDRFAPDLSAAGLETGGDHAGVAAAQSEGGVDALNLPNAWTSDQLDAGASLLGVGTPDLSVGAYRSAIQSGGHTFSTIGLLLEIGGAATHVDAFLLDDSPDGCFAASDVVGHVGVSCQDVRGALP